MKLSTAISKWKDKNISKDIALKKAKESVKSVGERWTKSKQEFFDKIWNKKSIPVSSTVKTSSPLSGSLTSKIKYLKSLLKGLFPDNAWGTYGLHYVKETSDKRPGNVKKALDLLDKEGFKKVNRQPMNSDFADRGSERAITWYKDMFGNTANTVSQKSSNGKTDFYIFNITFSTTEKDRSKIGGYQAELDSKLKIALDKAERGEYKNIHKSKKSHELTFRDFVKRAKGTSGYRDEIKQNGSDKLKEQWIEEIEKALSLGKTVPKEVLEEYNLYSKNSGSIYKLMINNKQYKTVSLNPQDLNKIKKSLLSKGKYLIKSDDGDLFTLLLDYSNPKVWACDKVLKKAIGINYIYIFHGRI